MEELKKIFTDMLDHIDNHKDAYKNPEWTNERIVDVWIKTNEAKLKSNVIHDVSIHDVSIRDYDPDFEEVECDSYEYQQMPDDADEKCNKGIGIENCNHCIFNKKLHVC